MDGSSKGGEMKSPIACKNPQHPSARSRNEMELLKETETESYWACKACLEINRVVSGQVRTKPAYQRHVRRELAKQARLLTEAPKRAPMPRFYK